MFVYFDGGIWGGVGLGSRGFAFVDFKMFVTVEIILSFPIRPSFFFTSFASRCIEAKKSPPYVFACAFPALFIRFMGW